MGRIVIDARESGTSTGRYIDRLLQYLHTLRPPHEIIVLTKAHRVDILRTLVPDFQIVESNCKEFTFSEQLGLLRQIRSLKPDLVHFGKDHQPVLYRGLHVTTMHDLTTARFRNPAKHWLVFKSKQLVYTQVVRLVARSSRAVLTPSQFVKDDLVRFTGIQPRKVVVTYESADPIIDSPAPLPDLQNKQFIMYVGRPTPHKNLGRLIDAFVLLQRNHPALHLVLAGLSDGNYARHASRVAAEGIKNVYFTGFITEGQLRWLYEHCQAYVFPSLSEGFGLPGLEAMVHGAPVVSSNATCLPEIYGQAARYFDPLNASDMGARIAEVLNDPVLRQGLVTLGHQQAAKYSWQRMAEQTLAVYEAALAPDVVSKK